MLYKVDVSSAYVAEWIFLCIDIHVATAYNKMSLTMLWSLSMLRFVY